MARLARLVLAGQAHYVIQRGLGGQVIFAGEHERQIFLALLRESAAAEGVRLHAYALLDDEVQLLATPEAANGLSRLMQAVGRRYVSAYNRRHGRSGTLWDGRFRCSVLEGGTTRLDVLRLIDGQSCEPGVTSASARDGGRADPALSHPPEYWQLGNTPFEREAAYRALLAQGLPEARVRTLRHAALGGWAAGLPAFAEQVQQALQRPARPRAPGRPRRTAA